MIIEKLNLLITKETENEMKYELENEYTRYIADSNFIKDMLAENSKYFIPEIPSKREELLKQVINSKVKKMIRYALDPIDEYLDEYELEEKEAFSLSEGALVIEFENGISLGFNSDEEISSIIVWAETYHGKQRSDQLRDDKELFPIFSNDTRFSEVIFSEINNQTLVKYEIIKQEPYSATYYGLPRECGLCLIFSNGSQIIMAHQLTNKVPNNFAILEWRQIDEEIYQTLYKTSQFWK